jgi:hypothetical protein
MIATPEVLVYPRTVYTDLNGLICKICFPSGLLARRILPMPGHAGGIYDAPLDWILIVVPLMVGSLLFWAMACIPCPMQ